MEGHKKLQGSTVGKLILPAYNTDCQNLGLMANFTRRFAELSPQFGEGKPLTDLCKASPKSQLLHQIMLSYSKKILGSSQHELNVCPDFVLDMGGTSGEYSLLWLVPWSPHGGQGRFLHELNAGRHWESALQRWHLHCRLERGILP